MVEQLVGDGVHRQDSVHGGAVQRLLLGGGGIKCKNRLQFLESTNSQVTHTKVMLYEMNVFRGRKTQDGRGLRNSVIFLISLAKTTPSMKHFFSFIQFYSAKHNSIPPSGCKWNYTQHNQMEL